MAFLRIWLVLPAVALASRPQRTHLESHKPEKEELDKEWANVDDQLGAVEKMLETSDSAAQKAQEAAESFTQNNAKEFEEYAEKVSKVAGDAESKLMAANKEMMKQYEAPAQKAISEAEESVSKEEAKLDDDDGDAGDDQGKKKKSEDNDDDDADDDADDNTDEEERREKETSNGAAEKNVKESGGEGKQS
eukprot:CAMPEP_0197651948 /NCGR_PEP_ID=MMETSP1338-20131121/34155_1 /TAXON_ID=43686 ORGANISM="Pelagodinium beii, Strain RCC1491" /NCGR_SAMPLE_ID=MMETSP1338 /ASSEMBLY_ACC=CAM_ASM_000754 /LENGTH=190 /DNA_ID=CAMNT_0043226721 /DNA_START=102 /DNA_END=674 /DNA_ORIENTATION=-